MRLASTVCVLLVIAGVALADHGGNSNNNRQRNGRNRNNGNRNGRRGGRTVIRAKPKTFLSQNFPAANTKAAPDFSNLGPPPQPAGFRPPHGVPARAGRVLQPVAAAPAPAPRRQNRRPAPQQKAVRSGRQQSASDPDVRGNSPDENGNYDFNFQTDDGTFREETGSNVAPDTNEVRGSYSYTSPEGELVTVNYYADETGFHATGSHIPVAPPIHPSIQRGLDLIARVNARKQQQG